MIAGSGYASDIHRTISSHRRRRVLIFQKPVFNHLGIAVCTPLDSKAAPSARVAAAEGQGTRPRTPPNDGNYNMPSSCERRAASRAELGRFDKKFGSGGAGKE